MCAETMRCIPCAPDSSRNSAPVSVAVYLTPTECVEAAADSVISALYDDADHVDAWYDHVYSEMTRP